jgi:DNA-binding NarL/FixJ family response regulator
MSDVIRLMLVDDHPIVRAGMIAVLATQPDFEVSGEASTGSEALMQVARVCPDVVLLDLEMPGLDGVETLQRLREQNPGIRVVVFTAFDTDERIVSAVQAGARGYLLKGSPREDLFQAIRVVHQGGSLLHPLVATKLLQHINRDQGAARLRADVTGRQMEVVTLLAQGLQNKEIATRLGISERTVKFHVGALLRKLHAGNRTELVAVAARAGLVSVS